MLLRAHRTRSQDIEMNILGMTNRESSMTPLEVKDRLGSIPWMTLEQGQTISHFIQKHAVSDVLELGFCHGVSTCYMAAALAARGGGTITTIDLESSA